MKTPLCEACTKSGILCAKCEEKKNAGEISETDVSLAQHLAKLDSRGFIKNASFDKTIDLGSLIIVVTSENVGTLVGRGGRVVRMLSKEMGKKVRIINGKDFKTAIQDLVAPARVTGINIVYATEGEKTKVIIPENDKYRLISDLATIEKAANELSEKTILIELR